MDRYEADWSMVERGWKAHVLGEAEHRFADAGAAIKALRKVCGWLGLLGVCFWLDWDSRSKRQICARPPPPISIS